LLSTFEFSEADWELDSLELLYERDPESLDREAELLLDLEFDLLPELLLDLEFEPLELEELETLFNFFLLFL